MNAGLLRPQGPDYAGAMAGSRHRFVVLPALTVALAGCSSSGGPAADVPSPPSSVAKLCGALDRALPATVGGLPRKDPEPASPLTAGWGSPQVVLRCGVPQPPKMLSDKVEHGQDPDAVSGAVDSVDWLMEKQPHGAHRFTTANREAYVEVHVPATVDGSAVLIDLAESLKQTIPEGTADS